MEYRLAHQQRFLQKFSLTPQMKQSIQLLGMSLEDLSSYVDSIVARNPFVQKLIDDKSASRHNKYSQLTPRDRSSYEYQESITEEKTNPRLNLLSRLRMMGLDDKTIEVAEYLIFELDENGYLNVDLDEAAADLSVVREDVEKALALIQSMEPAGIGARDLKECLQLQLKRQHKDDSLEYKIVSSCLNLVARNDITGISKALKINKAKVQGAIDNIKKLNPRPASTILGEEADKVAPELFAKVDKKKVYLELNRKALPELKLYNPYENNLDIIKDADARKFLKENMEFAKRLIDSLKRREDTICKVANYILGVQQDALSRDGGELKALTMKDVARALDFHPSTINRAVSNKYIEVNGKVLSMKQLLSSGIEKEGGGLMSKTAIKKKIAVIVANENTSRPFSDDAIKDKLRQDGIVIERRTIAKYRQSLKILPAYLRKRR